MSSSKYGLKFEKRPEEAVKLCEENHIYLVEDKKRSWCKDPNRHHNMLIEGENYQALKLLTFTHKGKIGLIYIDPPYNTGNKDFVYNDKFVDKDDSWRHSSWLSFMSSRLKLAKELLSDDGVICISIDDNEFAQLKMLCDQIFGEENKLACITVINNLKGRSDSDNFAPCHEYLLVYAKNNKKGLINGRKLTKEESEEYSEQDEISPYKLIQLKKTGQGDKREDRPNLYYPIYYEVSTKKISLEPINKAEIILPLRSNGTDGRWTCEKSNVLEKINTEIVVKFSSGKYNVYQKMRDLVDGQPRTRKIKTVWNDPSHSTTTSANEIKKDFGEKGAFDFAKPINFIKDVVRMASKKDTIVLDFFAGSGTTGLAVAELNKEDDGTRQFILCTNNENGICHEITYPRQQKNIIYTENLRYFNIKTIPFKNKAKADLLVQLQSDHKIDLAFQIRHNCFTIKEENEKYTVFTNNKNECLIVYFDQMKYGKAPHEVIQLEKKFASEKYSKLSLYKNHFMNGYSRTYFDFFHPKFK